MVTGIKDIFIIFGSLFAFVLMIGKLAERNRTRERTLTILILFNIGIYQLISYTLYCNPVITIPGTEKWTYILEAAGFMLFLMHGPLHYGYCNSVVSPLSPLPKHYWLNFLPGILYAMSYIPFAYMSSIMAPASEGTALFLKWHDKIYLLSIILTVISYDSYLLICIKKIFPYLNMSSDRIKILLCSMTKRN